MIADVNEQVISNSAECPAGHMRKTLDPMPKYDPIEILDDGTWRINGFSEVRQVLRNDIAGQAGFSAENAIKNAGGLMKNPPILYLEGEEHHKARRETNRFFTPNVTNRDYREFMNEYADELIARLKQEKQADLSDLSMDMAVQVASKIVGLTDSIFPGIKPRLEALIKTGDDMINGKPSFLGAMQGNWNMLAFYISDVRPAIRNRRKNPQEDVISYLIGRGYADFEMMTECIVYGVAGMVTTREFISVAMWHLLENPRLMERMKVGEEAERYAILHEILRLEPVVAHLYRRTSQELTIQSDGKDVIIPANTKLDLNVGVANIDDSVMGDNASAVCPARDMAELRPKVPAYGMSFGDGSHRCPGAYVAIQESDIFIRKLLEVDGLRIEKKPSIGYMEIAESYELRDFILAVD
ncbi:MAG: cytochrome P450 [Phototrophicaceae bacterium]